MSEIRINILDASRAVNGTLHGSLADAILAGLAAEPETIEELEHAIARFAKPEDNEHLKNIYETGEIRPDATIRNFRIVQKEGQRTVVRSIDYYSLDAIISVGYRVNSVRATQFRQWATSVLREFAIKGYVLDRLFENDFDKIVKQIEAGTKKARK
jgi:hypothetical protein